MQIGTHAERATRGKATVDVIRRHAQAATQRTAQQPAAVHVSAGDFQGHFVPTSIYGISDAPTQSDQTGVDLANDLLEVRPPKVLQSTMHAAARVSASEQLRAHNEASRLLVVHMRSLSLQLRHSGRRRDAQVQGSTARPDGVLMTCRQTRPPPTRPQPRKAASCMPSCSRHGYRWRCNRPFAARPLWAITPYS